MSDYQQQGGGNGIRLLIAIVLALVGLFSYYSHTQVNPVTGEKQHIAITTDQETALGLQAAPEMAAKMGGEVPSSDPRTQLVQRVGNRVYLDSDARQSPYTFNFHLLNDAETINAFALPGGQVFITLGLFNKLENEAQLAGVLGHEIGHVINRHAAEQMAKTDLGQKLATSVGIAASDNRGHGMGAAMVASAVNQMMQLKFSRRDESEADEFGLRYMAQAGFDPTAMLGVMKILMDASKNSHTPELFATHPQPEHRIERIQAFLDKNYPNGTPSDLTMGRPIQHALPTSHYSDEAR